MLTNRPIEIFFSYAHEDEDLMNDVRRQLVVYERNGRILKWHDRMIPAGAEWRNEIDERLERADIILLFLSPHFIESHYCYEVEGCAALKRLQSGKAEIIPVILRPCSWSESPFAALQVLPRDGRPVSRWSDRDEACLNVARGVMALVDTISLRAPVLIAGSGLSGDSMGASGVTVVVARGTAGGKVSAANRRMLWIEDCVSTFLPVREALSNLGVIVDACTSFAEADRLLSRRADHYGLVVCDNVVPDDRVGHSGSMAPADDPGARYLLELLRSDVGKAIRCPIVLFTFFTPSYSVLEDLRTLNRRLHVIEKDGMPLHELVDQLAGYVTDSTRE